MKYSCLVGSSTADVDDKTFFDCGIRVPEGEVYTKTFRKAVKLHFYHHKSRHKKATREHGEYERK